MKRDGRPLSKVCCERDTDPDDQQRRILELIAAGADVGETDKNGATPLHHAVRFRNAVAVKLLIEHGASVNQVCKRSRSTPLHRAVTSTGAPGTAGKNTERIEIVRLLVQAGADTSIRNKEGKTVLDYTNDPKLLRLLNSADRKN